MIATTLFGFEGLLAAELELAGASSIERLNRAVSFAGDRELLYRANIVSRTASRILLPVRHTRVRSEKELYSAARDVEWKRYIGRKSTFAVDSVVNSRHFNHSKYVALKVKDAIADQLRDKFGSRPDVDRKDPDVQVHVHIDRERLTISLDSSGIPLHRRGYRLESGGAPLGESLAAGMLLLAGYDGSVPFVDPMAGSGTLLVEAALIAARHAPGLLREKFGYAGWKDFDRRLHQKVIADARKMVRVPPASIAGCDISADAVRTARANLRRSGMEEAVSVRKSTFEEFTPPEGPGVMITNPPYGERMGSEDIADLYGRIGDMLKKSYQGYEAWLISSNREALKSVGLRPSKKITLFNGPLECRYHNYSIYSGSRKSKYRDGE